MIETLGLISIRVEESEHEKSVDMTASEEPPVYNISLVFPDSSEEFQMAISQKLTTVDLIKKIAMVLSVPKERVSLYDYSGEVTKESLPYLNSIFLNLATGRMFSSIDKIEEGIIARKRETKLFVGEYGGAV